MYILIMIWLAIVVVCLALLLRGGKKAFIDYTLFFIIGISVGIICNDFMNVSGFWYYVCEIAVFLLLELAYVFYTMRTETITVSALTKQKKLFGTSNVIKTKNNKIFTINNVFFIQRNAHELIKKICIGHRYKITVYRLLFTGYNILSATEVKSSVRKKTGKKSK